MENRESRAMTEIRKIRKELSEQMKEMTNEQIVEFIQNKSFGVEKEFGLELSRLEKTAK